MKTKIVAAVALVALLSVALIGGTIAWLTDNDEAINTFTFGKVVVDLKETSTVVNGEKDVLEFDKIVPGGTYSKEPYVVNTGSVDCYVRVKVELPSGVTIGALGAGWEQGKGTDYYYTKPLNTVDGSEESKTTNLFTEVTIDGTHFTNEIINDLGERGFNIPIKVEAIQAEGFADYEKAWKDKNSDMIKDSEAKN